MENNLAEQFVRIADQMEMFADDPKYMKELRRDYKRISDALYPPKKENQYSAKEIKESRAEALKTVEKYLQAENIEEQFNERGGDYHSRDKFLVSWKANLNGMRIEVSLDKTDGFFTNAKCIEVKRNLFYEKQVKAYGSFERGLLEVGLKLCANKEEKRQFFEKYVTVYNERIKNGNN